MSSESEFSESDLRAMLRAEHNDHSPQNDHAATIDLAAVTRRSARRHHGQQIAVGTLGTLAVVGIGAVGITGIRGIPTASTSSAGSSSQSDSSTSEQGYAAPAQPPTAGKRASADRINRCGAPLAQVAPDASGLVFSVDFPATASATAASITGQVTMTNTGTQRLTGTTAASPAITLSQDGTVLWHSNGPTVMMVATVDLAPGASMTYPAAFTPVRCSADDEVAESFPSDLPPVGAGNYDVSAAIDFSRTDAAGAFVSTDLITGPVAPITLR
ncbi:MAG: hypothetical protein ABWX98_02720 [Lacisediminihabitans sp.]